MDPSASLNPLDHQPHVPAADTTGYHWLPLVTTGYHWLHWSLLVSTGYHWLPMGITGYRWLLLVTNGHYLVTSGHYWLPLSITGYH